MPASAAISSTEVFTASFFRKSPLAHSAIILRFCILFCVILICPFSTIFFIIQLKWPSVNKKWLEVTSKICESFFFFTRLPLEGKDFDKKLVFPSGNRKTNYLLKIQLFSIHRLTSFETRDYRTVFVDTTKPRVVQHGVNFCILNKFLE